MKIFHVKPLLTLQGHFMYWGSEICTTRRITLRAANHGGVTVKGIRTPKSGLTHFLGKVRLDDSSECSLEVSIETVEEIQTPSMRREALRNYAKAMLRAYLAEQEEKTNEPSLGIL
jgi:hypothetical protein